MVLEILHQMRIRNRKEKLKVLLKSNMKKAYDHVEWDFL